MFDANPAAEWYNRSYDIRRNQVFSSDEFVPLVVALQAAQQAGQGIVVQRQLTTVQNNWYFIHFSTLPYCDDDSLQWYTEIRGSVLSVSVV